MNWSSIDVVRGAAVVAAATFAFTTASAQQGLVFPVEPVEVMQIDADTRVEVYEGTVDRVRGNRVTMRFPHGERHTYTVPLIGLLGAFSPGLGTLGFAVRRRFS